MAKVNLNKLPQRGAALMGALADPTRKTIFNLLLEKPLVVKVIAADLPISQSAVSQHLKVMKESGLVLEEKQGRSHLYAANPAALDWLSWQFGLLRDDILRVDSAQDSVDHSSDYDVVDSVMDDWAQQWPELDVLSTGLMLRFCLIGRHLEWLLERLATHFNMTTSQILILSTLDRMAEGECSLKELARVSFTQLHTTEDHIKSIEECGYIARRQDAGITLIKLTNTGKEILHQFYSAQRSQSNTPIYQMEADKQLKLTTLLRPLLFDLRNNVKYDFGEHEP